MENYSGSVTGMTSRVYMYATRLSTVMLADILTKGTARAIFLELLSLLDSYSTSGEESLSSSYD